MFSCWIFQILNGSDTVALTCDFAEDFVYQIGKLFFEDDDQTDQYNDKFSPCLFHASKAL